MIYVHVKLPAESHVLLLEDSPMRIAWFKKRIPHLTVVSNVEDFKQYFLNKPICDFIFFDHDLGEGCGTGEDAATFIKEHFGGNTTNAGIIHTWNPSGAAKMKVLLPLTLWIPFGEFEVEVEQAPPESHSTSRCT
jgi:hypothetical protein